MSLATRYRPNDLDNIVGNESVKRKIKEQFAVGKLGTRFRHQSWLFTGPYGCGKTTFARIMAKMVECSGSAFHEFNTSNTRGIDTIREIESAAQLMPINGNVKVFMLDECHQISRDGQEALLKILEEPPKHVYFILATAEPEKLSKGIIKSGRVMKCEVDPLTDVEIGLLVNKISELEGIPSFPEIVIKKIIDKAKGVPREALTLLDSVLTIAPVNEKEALNIIENIDYSESQVNEVCQLLLKTGPNRWKEVVEKLKNLKGNPEDNRRNILNYLNACLCNSYVGEKGDRIAKMMNFFKDPTTYTGKAGLSHSCYLSCRL